MSDLVCCHGVIGLDRAEHMHEAPVLVIACVGGRPEQAGTAQPAAVCARGPGTAWATLH